MKFSLVLPVYGVESYIEKCIISCANQSDFPKSDYELVIVNDSTPDKSIEIAQNVLKGYPDINYRIINRPNGGLSAARNSGLEAATGEYIWFVDSDDFIEPDSLAKINAVIEKNPNVEIVSFSHRNIYPDHSEDQMLPAPLIGHISRGMDFISKTAFYSAWARVYKHSLLNSLGAKFAEGILWEDGEFNLRVISLVESHFCMPDVLYNYMRRPGSISTSGKVARTLDSDIYKYNSLNDWIAHHNYSEQDLKILNKRNNESLIFYLAGIPQLEAAKRDEYFKRLSHLLPMMSKTFGNSISSKDKYIYLMIKHFPRLTSRLLSRKMNKILNKEQEKFSEK